MNLKPDTILLNRPKSLRMISWDDGHAHGISSRDDPYALYPADVVLDGHQ